MALLVISDSNIERLSLYRTLARKEGHRTLLAGDGLTCLQKATTVTPALVLSEVNLPELDGFGLSLSIREEISSDSIQIILLKSEVTAADKTTATGVGANAILAHSQDCSDLLDSIRVCLSERTSVQNGLAGSYDQSSLFDLLQLLHRRRLTGTLSLSGIPSTIAFENGEIVGASMRGFRGKAAFQKALQKSSGRYCFDNDRIDTSCFNIDSSFDALMIAVFASMH